MMVSEVRHRHGNSVTILQCARINKSIIYVCKQKAPIYKLSLSKAPKPSKFRVTDIQENQWTFLWYRKGVDLSSRNNFANQAPLKKFLYLYHLLFIGLTSNSFNIKYYYNTNNKKLSQAHLPVCNVISFRGKNFQLTK